MKIEEKYSHAIAEMNEGNDMIARFTLSTEIEKVINDSNNGVIALPDFLNQIQSIINNGQELNKIWLKNQ
jgi:hypothetical protein